MSDTPPPRDEDLERADALLDKADALLGRHHETDDAAPASAGGAPSPEGVVAPIDDDLPVLTDIVEDFPPPAPAPRTTRLAADPAFELELARIVDAWLAAALPPLIERELERCAERLQAQLRERLQAELLPAASATFRRHLGHGQR
jgi:hypothetical protein